MHFIYGQSSLARKCVRDVRKRALSRFTDFAHPEDRFVDSGRPHEEDSFHALKANLPLFEALERLKRDVRLISMSESVSASTRTVAVKRG